MSKLIDKKKYFERKEEMVNFLINNHNRYGLETTTCLATIFQFDLMLDDDHPLNYEEAEILSKFGVFKKDCDMYKKFNEFLRERDFLRGNVVEVGAGVYPRLCEVIMEDKPVELVNVTAYDPKLVFETIPGVNFVNKPFTKETNIDDVDTLYGLFPCAASITLIDKAIEENKNLLIAFCPCDHSDKEHMKWFGKYWAEDVCDDYIEKYGKKIEITKWNKEIGFDYPIMTYRRQK